MESISVNHRSGESAGHGFDGVNDTPAGRLGFMPGDFDPLLDMAKLKIEFGELEAAQEIYTGLLFMEPQNYTYLYGHANCALLMHQYEIANISALIMTLLDSENPYGFLFVGHARLAMKQLAEARSYLQTALELACKTGDEHAKKRALQLLIHTKDR